VRSGLEEDRGHAPGRRASNAARGPGANAPIHEPGPGGRGGCISEMRKMRLAGGTTLERCGRPWPDSGAHDGSMRRESDGYLSRTAALANRRSRRGACHRPRVRSPPSSRSATRPGTSVEVDFDGTLRGIPPIEGALPRRDGGVPKGFAAAGQYLAGVLPFGVSLERAETRASPAREAAQIDAARSLAPIATFSSKRCAIPEGVCLLRAGAFRGTNSRSCPSNLILSPQTNNEGKPRRTGPHGRLGWLKKKLATWAPARAFSF
jgi:hypothetical protein